MMTPLLVRLTILACLLPACRAEELYLTDFETFPVGDNHWAGNDGWRSNDTSSGAQGILEDFLPEIPLGRIAYLGFERPLFALTTVVRPLDYDPASTGDYLVEFESLLGIQDSTNGYGDHFLIAFYDLDGRFMAALGFDNSSKNAEVIRWQGDALGFLHPEQTGVPFLRGDQLLGIVALQILHTRINLRDNTWSALLDGVPLFKNAPFSAPEFVPLTLGAIAAEWELGTASPNTAGNNWLLVADWSVRTIPPSPPFLIDSIWRRSDGCVELTWPAEPGFLYSVHASSNLVDWEPCPPDLRQEVEDAGKLSFIDPHPDRSRRFYRVKREPAR